MTQLSTLVTVSSSVTILPRAIPEIDLVPVYEKMEQSKEVVTNKMGERFREQNTEITVLENRVTETEKSIAVLQTEFDLLDLRMEEFTLKNSNPLQ